jgi:hypothetical protein
MVLCRKELLRFLHRRTVRMLARCPDDHTISSLEGEPNPAGAHLDTLGEDPGCAEPLLHGIDCVL